MKEKELKGFASAELGMPGASISEQLTYGPVGWDSTDEVVHPKLPTTPEARMEHRVSDMVRELGQRIEDRLRRGGNAVVEHGVNMTIEYGPTPEDVKQATAEANARGEGFKADSEKPRWDLLDLGTEADVVRVLTHGAKKYSDGNWKKVPDARARYFAAALRHLAAYQAGERADPESGLPHLAHAACCIHFLAWFDRHGGGES